MAVAIRLQGITSVKVVTEGHARDIIIRNVIRMRIYTIRTVFLDSQNITRRKLSSFFFPLLEKFESSGRKAKFYVNAGIFFFHKRAKTRSRTYEK